VPRHRFESGGKPPHSKIEDRQPLTCEIGKPPVLWNDGIALARPANTARRTEGGAFAATANRVL